MGCPPLITLPRSLPPPPPQSASPGAVIVISVQPAPWGSMEKLEGGKKPWLCLSKNLVVCFTVMFKRRSVIWTQGFHPTFEKLLSCQASCLQRTGSLSVLSSVLPSSLLRFCPQTLFCPGSFPAANTGGRGLFGSLLPVHHQGEPG